MSAARSNPAPPAGGLTADERGLAASLFDELFAEVSAIGCAEDGSSTRLAWSEEIAQADAWFDRTAARLGLEPSRDRNGNRWAWSGPPDAGATVTGSHLDTVPHGGRYDGALGVVAGLVAAHLLGARGGESRPLAVVSFADEEGGRFGTPTCGSRLAVGALRGADVLNRVDAAGITLREALRCAGVDPDGIGPDPEAIGRIGAFVEVHIEQGRALEDLGRPLGVARSILPHGRWRLDLLGEANHGGTTALTARRDPMLALAEVIRAGRRVAEEESALVTVGKLDVWPNSTNSVAARVSTWLDVRAADDAALGRVVGRVGAAAHAAAAQDGVVVCVTEESRVGAVHFSEPLRERIVGVLDALDVGAVLMDTGAGHDAGALAAGVRTAMLFVRNPTGVSHSATESARREDCLEAIAALVAVLDELGRKR